MSREHAPHFVGLWPTAALPTAEAIADRLEAKQIHVAARCGTAMPVPRTMPLSTWIAAQHLARWVVSVSSFHRWGAVRVSPYVYNSLTDIEAFVAALAEAVEALPPQQPGPKL